ncbi:MAG TPA: amidohydrolase family protein, partial [Anaerolineales bacterium]
MKTIIKSGTLITASDKFTADIFVDGEKITQIGEDLKDESAKIVDARGKLVMPGGIDPHTHFDLPMFNTVSSDDHYTGHKAAAFGGTTTVMDFVPQERATLKENVELWRAKADPKA